MSINGAATLVLLLLLTNPKSSSHQQYLFLPLCLLVSCSVDVAPFHYPIVILLTAMMNNSVVAARFM